MKGVVLAGGTGSRLRPITFSMAKQLVPVANKPILFYGLEDLAEAGITEVGIVVSPETGDEVRAVVGDGATLGLDVTFIVQDRPLGLAHALKTALPFVGGDDCLMYLGDNLVKDGVRDVVADFREHQPNCQIMLSPVDNPSAFGVAEVDEEGGIVRLIEKPKVPPSNLALVGVYLFDSTIHLGPAVVLRGTPEAEQYYEVLIAELEQRIADGVAAVDNERHRYYWEGMPVWGKLRDHAELFASQCACVVASTYCNSWIFEPLGETDPFEGMARSYTELFIVRSEDFKERYLKSMFETYGIDGIIYHDAKTCPNNSNCRYGMSQRLRRETGVPFVTINGDLNDLRLYSEEQARTQFEALGEQLQEEA